MFEPLAGRLEELDSRAKHDDVMHGTLHDIALSDETGTTENNLPQPDFIKIDAQAGELKVLKGAEKALKECQFLFLEVWARRIYGPNTPLFHELATYLYEQNFMMYDMFIEYNGRDADGTLRYFDAMFINRDRSSFPAWAL